MCGWFPQCGCSRLSHLTFRTCKHNRCTCTASRSTGNEAIVYPLSHLRGHAPFPHSVSCSICNFLHLQCLLCYLGTALRACHCYDPLPKFVCCSNRVCMSLSFSVPFETDSSVLINLRLKIHTASKGSKCTLDEKCGPPLNCT